MTDITTYLPKSRDYPLDYCSVWLHGKCYFYRKSADAEWILEPERNTTADTTSIQYEQALERIRKEWMEKVK